MRIPRLLSRTRRTELDYLRLEVEQLTRRRDRLRTELTSPVAPAAAKPGRRNIDDNVYVLHDDTAEARAFDEFYRAYDEVHVKTRKFLLD